MLNEIINCDVEHVQDYDEATGVLIRSEGDLGVIEVRGLENIVILRFNRDEWNRIVQETFDVAGELLDASG